jgi:hypothetical protein
MGARPVPLLLDTPPALHYGRLRIIYDLLRHQRVVPKLTPSGTPRGIER